MRRFPSRNVQEMLIRAAFFRQKCPNWSQIKNFSRQMVSPTGSGLPSTMQWPFMYTKTGQTGIKISKPSEKIFFSPGFMTNRLFPSLAMKFAKSSQTTFKLRLKNIFLRNRPSRLPFFANNVQIGLQIKNSLDK